MAILNDDVNQLETFLDNGANRLVQTATTVVVIGGTFLYISPLVAVFAFIPIPIAFPFIFSLFMFVLFCNMLGMIPYTFTVTSHIIVTFALAIVIFFGVTIIGFVVHGIKYFNFFVPKGVPKALLPLLVIIEVISYLTRPVSLSVRLFANMMAGHTMLKVFGFFVAGMFFSGNIFISPLGIAPLAFIVAFTGLEILVAFLQAYVFAILTCIYLNDAIHMH